MARGKLPKCSKCGCTDAKACPVGCWWVSLDPPLCSQCATKPQIREALENGTKGIAPDVVAKVHRKIIRERRAARAANAFKEIGDYVRICKRDAVDLQELYDAFPRIDRKTIRSTVARLSREPDQGVARVGRGLYQARSR